ncbi:MAG: hypothetical protein OXC18_20045 [Desulfurellaceae bacterium]|nr:hypothetical protein [Desulfurellaceae bacterium]
MSRKRSQPDKQFRKPFRLSIILSLKFTPILAAKKDAMISFRLIVKFTAGQAAKKFVKSLILFTAGQAAQ